MNIKKTGFKITVSKPELSIVIICTEFNYLPKTINSIEDQNFNNIEIILVYDNNDNSNLELIQNYINGFNNIKIINNNDTKGLIFSISKGVLSSKGKYILIYESGFTLAKSNTLSELHYEILKSNIDILEFNLLINTRENMTNTSLSRSLCQHLKTDINLIEIKYNKDYIGIDQYKEVLCNHLIRTDLFKNILREYNLIKISRKIINYYDNIFLFLLYNDMTSFKHIDISGTVLNINNIKSLDLYRIKNSKNQIIKDSIFYINFLFDNTIDTFEAKEIVINEFINIMNIIYNKFNKLTTESNRLFEKFINSNKISEINKNLLYLYFKSLIN